MAKRAKKKTAAKKRKLIMWTPSSVAELRRHSKAKTPVVMLEKIFKRTGATIRQKAVTLGIPLGHTKGRGKR